MKKGRALHVALIAAHLVIAILVVRQVAGASAGAAFRTSSDIARYRLVVITPGTPYRHFGVPYPPLALGIFKVLGPAVLSAFARRLVVFNICCHAAIVWTLRRVWGRRAAWSYLALSAPLMSIVYVRSDLAAAALAVGGAALVKRGRLQSGALGLVAGAFVKVWPVVLIPGLAARRQWRAFAGAVLTGGVAVAAWVVWGGTGGPGQVLTARGARGWQFESVPGSLLRLVTRDPVRFEDGNGAWRLGAPPAIATTACTVILIVGLLWVWMQVYRRGARDGIAETAAITVALACGTLFSPQYVIWVVPFVAIAAAAGAYRLERWAGAVSVLTLLAWLSFDLNDVGSLRTEVLLLARNGALVGMLVVAAAELRRPAREAAQPNPPKSAARAQIVGA
jgi:hypothetical protein